MAKYVYPAIFTPEEQGGYSIAFPDIESCYTDADTLEEGIANANDVLALVLCELEENGAAIPTPSKINELHTNGEEFATLIGCDTLEYRKHYSSRAVKKTLTIPAWLNTMAEREELNFTAVLQKALKAELNLA